MEMQLAALAGALSLVVVAIALVFLLGMRAKSPFVLGPLVRLQRAVINPRQMRSAGSPGAYAAIIRHRGRTSGQPYETPVGVVAPDDGFLIALPYGLGARKATTTACARRRGSAPPNRACWPAGRRDRC